MANMKNFLLVLSFSSILTGCVVNDTLASLNESLETINGNSQKNTVMTDSTLTSICLEADKNELRANDQFVGKGIEFNGVLKSLGTDSLFNDSIMVTSGEVYTHINNTGINLRSLNKNEKLRVSGIIKSVSNDYTGCSLQIIEATVSPN